MRQGANDQAEDLGTSATRPRAGRSDRLAPWRLVRGARHAEGAVSLRQTAAGVRSSA